ncbi:hypothetical protein [Actinoplanes nipponensis]|uniref:hypothetical protein n=1 Tax=Actinoplanes nipponensis TaxID=135950 RepID=UPI0031EE4BB9
MTALTLVLPRWYVGDRRALTHRRQRPTTRRAATYLLREQLPDRATSTVVVDDVLWIDVRQRRLTAREGHLVLQAGPRHGGRGDAQGRLARRGLHRVHTPALRQDPGSLPTVTKLLTNSTPIATFGPQDGRIEIRRIDKNKSWTDCTGAGVRVKGRGMTKEDQP